MSAKRTTHGETQDGARFFGSSSREIIVAAGLSMVLLFRPWYDGIAYADSNSVFNTFVAILFALWSAHVLVQRDSVRYETAIALFGAFIVVCAVGSAWTVQFNATYRALLNWTAYFMLFVLAACGLRSPTGVGIVVGAFILTSTAETLWSFIHVDYVMPLWRKQALDPTILERNFGGSEMTDVIKSRLESNRAMGSLLFANALACWVLVGIPLAIGYGMAALKWVRTVVRSDPDATRNTNKRGLQVFVGSVSLFATIFYISFFFSWGHAGDHAVLWFLTCVVIPAYVGLVAHLAIHYDSVEPDVKGARRAFMAMLVPFGTFVVVIVYYSFYFMYAYWGDTWTNHLLRWGVYCLALPALSGVCTFFVLRAIGARKSVLGLLVVALALFAVLQTAGLARTYSRGGMLAVTTAIVVGAVLLLWARRRLDSTPSTHTRVAVSITVALFSFLALNRPWESIAEAAQAEPQLSVPRTDNPLNLEGVNPSFDAMMDPATALLRFSYWGSAVLMAKANPITGVGLGNFGTVYPRYQYIGAADVKQAHNDYLQILCETGVFGAALFGLFWMWFLVTGVRRILRETDAAHRWVLTGVFSAILGFLLHAGVDFDFMNPSLATVVYILAGAFLTLCRPPHEPPKRTVRARVMGGIFLAFTAVVVGAGQLVGAQDREIGDGYTQRVRLEMAQKLISIAETPRANRTQPPTLPDADVAKFIPSRSVREQFGKVFVPVGPNTTSARPLQPTESIPPNAVLVIFDPAAARRVSGEQIALWIEALEAADSRFPHNPELATHIYLWHDLLFSEARDSNTKLKIADACLAWARQCVSRSPYQVAYRNLLARALWRRGELETTIAQLDYYKEGIEQYRLAAELYPSRPEVWFDYGKQSVSFGEELKRNNLSGYQEYIDRGETANRRGEEIVARLKQIAEARAA